MMIAGWIVLGLSGFALVLAAQMRMLISVSLRRALADKFGGDHRDPAYRDAIASSGKTDTPGEHLAWLMETYPAPARAIAPRPAGDLYSAHGHSSLPCLSALDCGSVLSPCAVISPSGRSGSPRP
jgi:hypothetical protein